MARSWCGSTARTCPRASADTDAVVGAEWGRPTPSRTSQRNGYRHRDLDTRVGTIDVAVPKLRKGTYFPEWLLERRKRAESALITVVADCYLAGVSTRRMDQLVKTLGIDGLSKSQVSRMATDPSSITLRVAVNEDLTRSDQSCQD